MLQDVYAKPLATFAHPVCLTPTPGSYIPPSIAQARVTNFADNKLQILTDWIQRHENTGKEERAGIIYKTGEFATLVQVLAAIPNVAGMRVYFGSYTPTGNSDIDDHMLPEEENQLALIYTATVKVNNRYVDKGGYYFISPKGTLNLPRVIQVLPESTTTDAIKQFAWVTHYEEKVKVLEAVTSNKPAKETRSVLFIGRSFLDWLNEITCLQLQGELVEKVAVAFSAYGADVTVKNEDNVEVAVSHQLTLVITIATSTMTPTLTPFYFHSDEIAPFHEKRLRFDDTDFDTSVPCPPAQCAPPIP